MGIISLVDCSLPAILPHLCSDSFNSPHVGHISWEINNKPRVTGRKSMGKRLALISRSRVHTHEILLGHQANEQTIRR